MTAPATREAVIEVRGLRNQFGAQVVHDRLDLDVWRGEIVGVVGGSGSGKSVLMRSIIGLNRPAAGSVKLLGLGFFGPHAWGGFLLWGCLNAAGVLAARPLARALGGAGAAGAVVGRVLTFLFAALCWIPFFLPPGVPLTTGLTMLRRMLLPF